MNKLLKAIYRLFKLLILLAILAICVNAYVIFSVKDLIVTTYDGTESSVTEEDIEELKSMQPQCILILGASVNPDGTPSSMLADRMDTGIMLYKRGVASKLLLSGDNGLVEYNEVQGMKDYALSKGVPEEDIVMDHAGFSTYESVYRASCVFAVERTVVVTQKYHLYRSLYGCEKMGIEARGVAAGQAVYSGQEKREIREILARDKDFVKWMIKPEPTFLGEMIPIDTPKII